MKASMRRHPSGAPLVLFLVSVLASSPLPAGALLFDAPTDVLIGSSEGSRPVTAASADLDQDGFPDVLVASTAVQSCYYGYCNGIFIWLCSMGNGAVRWFLGGPDGDFRYEDYISIPRPLDLVLEDLNGDGYPDLAIVGADWRNCNCSGGCWNVSGEVSIHLGNGDGRFTDGDALHDLDGPRFVVAGDIDADGIPDLAVANELSSDVRVFYGNGDGTFAGPLALPFSGEPGGMAIGDVDGNGHADLVVTHPEEGNASLFLRLADGSFATSLLNPGDVPGFVELQDLDGDGNPDLIVVCDDDLIAVLMGLGDGSFSNPVSYTTVGSVKMVDVADMNDDGIPDLVAGGRAGTNVTFLRGNGDGTFADAEAILAGDRIYWVLAGEITGDAFTDLVTANLSGLLGPGSNDEYGKLWVFRGKTGGTSTVATPYPTGMYPKAVALADFDADADLDAAVTSTSDDVLQILQGAGDGTFQTRDIYPAADAPGRVATGDLNRDGLLDLVVVGTGNSALHVYLGAQGGYFHAGVAYPVGGSPRDVGIGDLNGDGSPDLVAVNAGDDSLSVLLGHGDGTFQGATSYPTGDEPLAVALGDLNADGRADVAVANRDSQQIWVYLGRGDGKLPGAARYASKYKPVDVAIADLNADGILDLAVANRGYIYTYFGSTTLYHGRLGVLLGHGDGSFAEAMYAEAEAGFFEALVLSDFNGNGFPDAALAGENGFALFTSQGNGSYDFTNHFVAGNTILFGDAGDVDGDGDPDLVVVDSLGHGIAVVENTRTGPCQDRDGDGFGDPASPLCGDARWDCDDEDPDRHAGTTEICDNGKDDDCDGYADHADPDCPCLDADGDGYGVPGNLSCGHAFTDCDDSDPLIYPTRPEVCDGVDNDCNGEVDDVDLDRDGYIDAGCGGDDCDDGNGHVNPGATEVCNGIDDDCDGITDNVDLDGDGYLASSCGGDDCDDSDPAVHPGREEVPFNGKDDDCNGFACSAVPGLNSGWTPARKLLSQVFWLMPLGLIWYMKIRRSRRNLRMCVGRAGVHQRR